MSGIFSSAADNRRMGWKSCISAALRRVTHEDWSLGFTSSARGALEEPIIQVRCSDSPGGLFAGAHPNPQQTFPVTFTRTWLVIKEREVYIIQLH